MCVALNETSWHNKNERLIEKKKGEKMLYTEAVFPWQPDVIQSHTLNSVNHNVRKASLREIRSALHDRRWDIIAGLLPESQMLWFWCAAGAYRYSCAATQHDIWHWEVFRSIVCTMWNDQNLFTLRHHREECMRSVWLKVNQDLTMWKESNNCLIFISVGSACTINKKALRT